MYITLSFLVMKKEKENAKGEETSPEDNSLVSDGAQIKNHLAQLRKPSPSPAAP